MTIKELYDKCVNSGSQNINKSMMLYFRNKLHFEQLIKETPTIPNIPEISKSERYYCWLYNITERPLCPHCNKVRKFTNFYNGYWPTCGSKECRAKSVVIGNKEHHDWVSVQQNMRKTYKERTGYEHNMQNPEFKKKFFDDYASKHNGEKCGVCSQKAIQNRNKTFEEKYNGNVRNALELGLCNKYGSISNFYKVNYDKLVRAAEIKSENDFNELLKRLNEMNYKFISEDISTGTITIQCNRCGTLLYSTRNNINLHYRINDNEICTKCDYKKIKFRSMLEQSVGSEIKTFYNKQMLFNAQRFFSGHECDIFLPDVKLAIEINGMYWHTELYKEKYNHITKKLVVEDNGYNLIQPME